MDGSSARNGEPRTRPPVLNVRRKSASTPRRWTLDDVVTQVSQLRALEAARQAVDADRRVTIEGIWPGAMPIALAGWYRAGPQPLLVLTAHFSEAETIAGELEELLGRSCEVFPPGSEEQELESLTLQATGQRLHVISQLFKYLEHPNGPPPIIVTTLPAVLQHVPAPGSLQRDQQLLQVGHRIDIAHLQRWLVDAGYHQTTSVQLPGEFAMRGGILDIFPPDEDHPARIELFDDEVESLRTFDVVTQRSVEQRAELRLVSVQGSVAQDGLILDYLPSDAAIFVHEPLAVQSTAESFLQRAPFPQRYASPPQIWSRIADFATVHAVQLADEGYLGQLIELPIGSVERIGGDLERLAADIDAHCGGRQVVVVAMNDGEAERLGELLAPAQAQADHRLHIVVSQLQTGFEILPDGPMLLTAGQLLHRSHVRRVTKRTKSKPIDSFLDLRPGDLVVHLSHGIGVYRGTELLDKNGHKSEHLVLEFA
ncbi:MAG: hypothetical protein D6753_02230, partial [Planctomycetota bacterium]